MPSRTLRTEVKGWPRNLYGCAHLNFINAHWGCWQEEELITEPLYYCVNNYDLCVADQCGGLVDDELGVCQFHCRWGYTTDGGPVDQDFEVAGCECDDYSQNAIETYCESESCGGAYCTYNGERYIQGDRPVFPSPCEGCWNEEEGGLSEEDISCCYGSWETYPYKWYSSLYNQLKTNPTSFSHLKTELKIDTISEGIVPPKSFTDSNGDEKLYFDNDQDVNPVDNYVIGIFYGEPFETLADGSKIPNTKHSCITGGESDCTIRSIMPFYRHDTFGYFGELNDNEPYINWDGESLYADFPMFGYQCNNDGGGTCLTCAHKEQLFGDTATCSSEDCPEDNPSCSDECDGTDSGIPCLDMWVNRWTDKICPGYHCCDGSGDCDEDTYDFNGCSAICLEDGYFCTCNEEDGYVNESGPFPPHVNNMIGYFYGHHSPAEWQYQGGNQGWDQNYDSLYYLKYSDISYYPVCTDEDTNCETPIWDFPTGVIHANNNADIFTIRIFDPYSNRTYIVGRYGANVNDYIGSYDNPYQIVFNTIDADSDFICTESYGNIFWGCEVPGCTQAGGDHGNIACNYNQFATVEDGSCTWKVGADVDTEGDCAHGITAGYGFSTCGVAISPNWTEAGYDGYCLETDGTCTDIGALCSWLALDDYCVPNLPDLRLPYYSDGGDDDGIGCGDSVTVRTCYNSGVGVDLLNGMCSSGDIQCNVGYAVQPNGFVGDGSDYCSSLVLGSCQENLEYGGDCNCDGAVDSCGICSISGLNLPVNQGICTTEDSEELEGSHSCFQIHDGTSYGTVGYSVATGLSCAAVTDWPDSVCRIYNGSVFQNLTINENNILDGDGPNATCDGICHNICEPNGNCNIDIGCGCGIDLISVWTDYDGDCLAGPNSAYGTTCPGTIPDCTPLSSPSDTAVNNSVSCTTVDESDSTKCLDDYDDQCIWCMDNAQSVCRDDCDECLQQGDEAWNWCKSCKKKGTCSEGSTLEGLPCFSVNNYTENCGVEPGDYNACVDDTNYTCFCNSSDDTYLNESQQVNGYMTDECGVCQEMNCVNADIESLDSIEYNGSIWYKNPTHGFYFTQENNPCRFSTSWSDDEKIPNNSEWNKTCSDCANVPCFDSNSDPISNPSNNNLNCYNQVDWTGIDSSEHCCKVPQQYSPGAACGQYEGVDDCCQCKTACYNENSEIYHQRIVDGTADKPRCGKSIWWPDKDNDGLPVGNKTTYCGYDDEGLLVPFHYLELQENWEEPSLPDGQLNWVPEYRNEINNVGTYYGCEVIDENGVCTDDIDDTCSANYDCDTQSGIGDDCHPQTGTLYDCMGVCVGDAMDYGCGCGFPEPEAWFIDWDGDGLGQGPNAGCIWNPDRSLAWNNSNCVGGVFFCSDGTGNSNTWPCSELHPNAEVVYFHFNHNIICTDDTGYCSDDCTVSGEMDFNYDTCCTDGGSCIGEESHSCSFSGGFEFEEEYQISEWPTIIDGQPINCIDVGMCECTGVDTTSITQEDCESESNGGVGTWSCEDCGCMVWTQTSNDTNDLNACIDYSASNDFCTMNPCVCEFYDSYCASDNYYFNYDTTCDCQGDGEGCIPTHIIDYNNTWSNGLCVGSCMYPEIIKPCHINSGEGSYCTIYEGDPIQILINSAQDGHDIDYYPEEYSGNNYHCIDANNESYPNNDEFVYIVKSDGSNNYTFDGLPGAIVCSDGSGVCTEDCNIGGEFNILFTQCCTNGECVPSYNQPNGDYLHVNTTSNHFINSPNHPCYGTGCPDVNGDKFEIYSNADSDSFTITMFYPASCYNNDSEICHVEISKSFTLQDKIYDCLDDRILKRCPEVDALGRTWYCGYHSQDPTSENYNLEKLPLCIPDGTDYCDSDPCDDGHCCPSGAQECVEFGDYDYACNYNSSATHYDVSSCNYPSPWYPDMDGDGYGCGTSGWTISCDNTNLYSEGLIQYNGHCAFMGGTLASGDGATDTSGNYCYFPHVSTNTDIGTSCDCTWNIEDDCGMCIDPMCIPTGLQVCDYSSGDKSPYRSDGDTITYVECVDDDACLDENDIQGNCRSVQNWNVFGNGIPLKGCCESESGSGACTIGDGELTNYCDGYYFTYNNTTVSDGSISGCGSSIACLYFATNAVHSETFPSAGACPNGKVPTNPMYNASCSGCMDIGSEDLDNTATLSCVGNGTGLGFGIGNQTFGICPGYCDNDVYLKCNLAGDDSECGDGTCVADYTGSSGSPYTQEHGCCCEYSYGCLDMASSNSGGANDGDCINTDPFECLFGINEGLVIGGATVVDSSTNGVDTYLTINTIPNHKIRIEQYYAYGSEIIYVPFQSTACLIDDMFEGDCTILVSNAAFGTEVTSQQEILTQCQSESGCYDLYNVNDTCNYSCCSTYTVYACLDETSTNMYCYHPWYDGTTINTSFCDYDVENNIPIVLDGHKVVESCDNSDDGDWGDELGHYLGPITPIKSCNIFKPGDDLTISFEKKCSGTEIDDESNPLPPTNVTQGIHDCICGNTTDVDCYNVDGQFTVDSKLLIYLTHDNLGEGPQYIDKQSTKQNGTSVLTTPDNKHEWFLASVSENFENLGEDPTLSTKTITLPKDLPVYGKGFKLLITMVSNETATVVEDTGIYPTQLLVIDNPGLYVYSAEFEISRGYMDGSDIIDWVDESVDGTCVNNTQLHTDPNFNSCCQYYYDCYGIRNGTGTPGMCGKCTGDGSDRNYEYGNSGCGCWNDHLNLGQQLSPANMPHNDEPIPWPLRWAADGPTSGDDQSGMDSDGRPCPHYENYCNDYSGFCPGGDDTLCDSYSLGVCNDQFICTNLGAQDNYQNLCLVSGVYYYVPDDVGDGGCIGSMGTGESCNVGSVSECIACDGTCEPNQYLTSDGYACVADEPNGNCLYSPGCTTMYPWITFDYNEFRTSLDEIQIGYCMDDAVKLCWDNSGNYQCSTGCDPSLGKCKKPDGTDVLDDLGNPIKCGKTIDTLSSWMSGIHDEFCYYADGILSDGDIIIPDSSNNGNSNGYSCDFDYCWDSLDTVRCYGFGNYWKRSGSDSNLCTTSPWGYINETSVCSNPDQSDPWRAIADDNSSVCDSQSQCNYPCERDYTKDFPYHSSDDCCTVNNIWWKSGSHPGWMGPIAKMAGDGTYEYPNVASCDPEEPDDTCPEGMTVGMGWCHGCEYCAEEDAGGIDCIMNCMAGIRAVELYSGLCPCTPTNPDICDCGPESVSTTIGGPCFVDADCKAAYHDGPYGLDTPPESGYSYNPHPYCGGQEGSCLDSDNNPDGSQVGCFEDDLQSCKCESNYVNCRGECVVPGGNSAQKWVYDDCGVCGGENYNQVTLFDQKLKTYNKIRWEKALLGCGSNSADCNNDSDAGRETCFTQCIDEGLVYNELGSTQITDNTIQYDEEDWSTYKSYSIKTCNSGIGIFDVFTDVTTAMGCDCQCKNKPLSELIPFADYPALDECGICSSTSNIVTHNPNFVDGQSGNYSTFKDYVDNLGLGITKYSCESSGVSSATSFSSPHLHAQALADGSSAYGSILTTKVMPDWDGNTIIVGDDSYTYIVPIVGCYCSGDITTEGQSCDSDNPCTAGNCECAYYDSNEIMTSTTPNGQLTDIGNDWMYGGPDLDCACECKKYYFNGGGATYHDTNNTPKLTPNIQTPAPGIAHFQTYGYNNIDRYGEAIIAKSNISKVNWESINYCIDTLNSAGDIPYTIEAIETICSPTGHYIEERHTDIIPTQVYPGISVLNSLSQPAHCGCTGGSTSNLRPDECHGCADPYSINPSGNFREANTIANSSECRYNRRGCMDPNSFNYELWANVGSTKKCTPTAFISDGDSGICSLDNAVDCDPESPTQTAECGYCISTQENPYYDGDLCGADKTVSECFTDMSSYCGDDWKPSQNSGFYDACWHYCGDGRGTVTHDELPDGMLLMAENADCYWTDPVRLSDASYNSIDEPPTVLAQKLREYGVINNDPITSLPRWLSYTFDGFQNDPAYDGLAPTIPLHKISPAVTHRFWDNVWVIDCPEFTVDARGEYIGVFNEEVATSSDCKDQSAADGCGNVPGCEWVLPDYTEQRLVCWSEHQYPSYGNCMGLSQGDDCSAGRNDGSSHTCEWMFDTIPASSNKWAKAGHSNSGCQDVDCVTTGSKWTLTNSCDCLISGTPYYIQDPVYNDQTGSWYQSNSCETAGVAYSDGTDTGPVGCDTECDADGLNCTGGCTSNNTEYVQCGGYDISTGIWASGNCCYSPNDCATTNEGNCVGYDGQYGFSIFGSNVHDYPGYCQEIGIGTGGTYTDLIGNATRNSISDWEDLRTSFGYFPKTKGKCTGFYECNNTYLRMHSNTAFFGSEDNASDVINTTGNDKHSSWADAGVGRDMHNSNAGMFNLESIGLFGGSSNQSPTEWDYVDPNLDSPTFNQGMNSGAVIASQHRGKIDNVKHNAHWLCAIDCCPYPDATGDFMWEGYFDFENQSLLKHLDDENYTFPRGAPCVGSNNAGDCTLMPCISDSSCDTSSNTWPNGGHCQNEVGGYTYYSMKGAALTDLKGYYAGFLAGTGGNKGWRYITGSDYGANNDCSMSDHYEVNVKFKEAISINDLMIKFEARASGTGGYYGYDSGRMGINLKWNGQTYPKAANGDASSWCGPMNSQYYPEGSGIAVDMGYNFELNESSSPGYRVVDKSISQLLAEDSLNWYCYASPSQQIENGFSIDNAYWSAVTGAMPQVIPANTEVGISFRMMGNQIANVQVKREMKPPLVYRRRSLPDKWGYMGNFLPSVAHEIPFADFGIHVESMKNEQTPLYGWYNMQDCRGASFNPQWGGGWPRSLEAYEPAGGFEVGSGQSFDYFIPGWGCLHPGDSECNSIDAGGQSASCVQGVTCSGYNFTCSDAIDTGMPCTGTNYNFVNFKSRGTDNKSELAYYNHNSMHNDWCLECYHLEQGVMDYGDEIHYGNCTTLTGVNSSLCPWSEGLEDDAEYDFGETLSSSAYIMWGMWDEVTDTRPYGLIENDDVDYADRWPGYGPQSPAWHAGGASQTEEKPLGTPALARDQRMSDSVWDRTARNYMYPTYQKIWGVGDYFGTGEKSFADLGYVYPTSFGMVDMNNQCLAWNPSGGVIGHCVVGSCSVASIDGSTCSGTMTEPGKCYSDLCMADNWNDHSYDKSQMWYNYWGFRHPGDIRSQGNTADNQDLYTIIGGSRQCLDMNNQAEHGGVFDWKAHFWVPFDDQDNNEAIELDLWTSYKFSNSAGVACNIKTFDDSSFPTVQELNDWPHPYYTGVGSNHPYVDNESSYMTGQQWKMSAGLDPYITSFAGDVCINWYDDE